MTRIATIVPRAYLPELTGGLEITTHNNVLAYRSAGFECVVFAGLIRNRLGTISARVLRKLKGPYSHIDNWDGYTVRRDIFHAVRLAETIRNGAFDAIVCSVSQNILAIEEVCALNLPTMFFVYDTGAGSYLHKTSGVRKKIYAVESDFVASAIAPHVEGPIRKIRPIIERSKYTVTSSGESVLMANPHPSKGGRILLDVATRLAHRHFLVVGGWQHLATQKDVRSVEVALSKLPNVTRVPHMDDIRPALQQSRCLIMPSIVGETYGRIAVEAMMAGLPVLSSDRGALPETIGRGGIAIDLNRGVEVWCSEVERLFQDKAHFNSLVEGARQTVEERDRQPEFIRQLLITSLRELLF